MHAGAQDANEGKPRRFATARQSSSRLFLKTSEATRAICEATCDGLDECLGYYLFVSSKGADRCTGLSALGDDDEGGNDGVLEGVTSWSYRKIDATTTTPTTTATEAATTTTSGESTTPTSTPDPGYWYKLIFKTPHRFANAKQRLTNDELNLLFLMQEDVTLHKCQMRCNSISNCKGIYFFVPVDFDTHRCYGMALPNDKESKLIKNPGFSYIRMDPGTEDSGELKSAVVETQVHSTSKGWVAMPIVLILMILVYVKRAAKVIAQPDLPPRKHFYPEALGADLDFDAVNRQLSMSPAPALAVANAAAETAMQTMGTVANSSAMYASTSTSMSKGKASNPNLIPKLSRVGSCRSNAALHLHQSHYYPPSAGGLGLDDAGDGPQTFLDADMYGARARMFAFTEDDHGDDGSDGEAGYIDAIGKLYQRSKTNGKWYTTLDESA